MLTPRTSPLSHRQNLTPERLSPNDVADILDKFLLEFERIQYNDQGTTKVYSNAVEKTADTILSICNRQLLVPELHIHPLIHFLHQYFISLLGNWCISSLSLNIQETNIFLKIASILIHLAEQAPKTNTQQDLDHMKDVISAKDLVSKLRKNIDNIAVRKGNLIYDQDFTALAILAVKLINGYPLYYNIDNNLTLIDFLTFNWLKSYDLKQVSKQIENGQTISDMEDRLLHTCWTYLCSPIEPKQECSSKVEPITMLHSLSDELLQRFNNQLKKTQTFEFETLSEILQKTTQLLTIPQLKSFDKHASATIDRLIQMLQQQDSTNSNNNMTITIILETFYYLSKDDDTRTIIKTRNLTPLVRQYISSPVEDHKKWAFAILAQIMDEQEANNNPSEIIANFMEQLKTLSPNEYDPNLDVTLSNISALMQYGKIKDEFVKQGGLEKLVSFICDGDVDKQNGKQLESAMRILWSCTFDNTDALNMLKQNKRLSSRVNEILEKSKEAGDRRLQKTAEGLLWRLEKEEKFLEEQAAMAMKRAEKRQNAEDGTEEEGIEEDEKYDCMISYSWTDTNLVHRIFKYLTEKCSYKVWLDQEQMHGSTIQAMAKAIESAEFILMCMSEAYKRSANCQSEAEYAFHRKKHIVPIRMKKDYVPDGWLGFILGSRIYIDFGKHAFDKAIDLLVNEIHLQKQTHADDDAASKKREEAICTNQDSEPEPEPIPEPKLEPEPCMTLQSVKIEINLNNALQWNEDEVRVFMKNKNLTDLLPIYDGLNGDELGMLHGMCKSNPIFMFQVLKSELETLHQKFLPISCFLHFVSGLGGVYTNNVLLNKHNYSSSFESSFGGV